MNCNVNFYYEDSEFCGMPLFRGELFEARFSVRDDNLELQVGLGDYESFTMDSVKEVFAHAVKELKKNRIKKAAFEVKEFTERFYEDILSDIAQGISLGGYEYLKHKTQQKIYKPEFKYVLEGKEIDSEYYELIQIGENIAQGIILARDLVNTPSNFLTPEKFAEKALEIGEENDIEVLVLDEKECKELSMGAFLAVGESSANLPRLIVLRYLKGEEDEETLGLVGKGITYDTGGYSLKSSQSMLRMKTDMGGAAAVMGTIYALTKNKVKTNVIGILPCCENRLSNQAIVPGDVIKSMNGKTIEVTNTDAEGRLILADAVTYAIRKENVDKIIDIATLTGAVVAALGNHIAGAVTNNKKYFKEFKKAYKEAGERYHLFPIDDIYREGLKSDIADIKNSGPKVGGCIFGGCFIEEFVEDIPWIHLDIAGTGNVEKPIFKYQSEGATGAGVASLYEFCEKEGQ